MRRRFLGKKLLLAVLYALVVPLCTGIAPSPVRAACDPLAADKGQAAHSITVPTDGNYTLWVRMWMPKTEADSAWVQIDAGCPILVGDAGPSDGFVWVGYQKGDKTAPIHASLAAGNHTVTVAGREAGVGVDRIVLVANDCTPTGVTGENCLQTGAPANVDTGSQNTSPTAAHGKAPPKTNVALKWTLISLSGLATLGSIGFLVWKYLQFSKRVGITTAHVGMAPDVVAGGVPTSRGAHIMLFLRAHRIAVAVSGAVIVAGVIVGIANAADSQSAFEVEDAKLSGGAVVAENGAASGGKYVLFQTNPVAASTNGSAKTGAGATGGGGTGGGTSGGGNTGGTSGGGGTPTPQWPGASNTGVPAGTVLTTYGGSCTLGTNTIIDSKTVNCDVTVTGTGVVIKNSKVNGTITTSGSGALTLQDSEVDSGVAQVHTLSVNNLTVLRANLHGGQTAINCGQNCDVRDSWLHGQNLPDGQSWHLDGVLSNGGNNFMFVHNTIACDHADNAAGGGCSGDVGLFGDFDAITNVTFDNNLFVSTPGSYCIYGGSHPSKPYGGDAANVVFKNNIFQRGVNNNCAAYGPVAGFDTSRPGAVWTNNLWDDGGTVAPVF